MDTNIVKVVAVSDLHGILDFMLPSGDILTISGDICPVSGSHSPTAQMFWLNNYFLPWCDKLIKDEIFKHVVFIAGNHDFVFKKIVYHYPESNFNFILPKNVHYLCDSEVTVKGIRIYGTPWAPTFGRWAYMHDEDILDNIYDKIPPGLDILLSHGPMFGANDTIMERGEKEHLGSKSLRKHILRSCPRWVFVGHIHSGSHNICKNIQMEQSPIHIVNVSILDENYNVGYKATEVMINVNDERSVE